ncbi:DNA-3-methyladenine glycosylase I [Patulibacter minatonensis]|uniref:DNA-3-methyladenine glycosylase I n=1 Tax=Patulibacter minatonensis TaxID=298163 RepID=UPI0009FE76BF|nr:DNA-3-methyladenine glycosylase I [Patulibacter minatonensis]
MPRPAALPADPPTDGPDPTLPADPTTGDDLVVGPDGVRRCRWGSGPVVSRTYHDREWGRPVRGERELYALLSLQIFQGGLSWLTVLRKRDAFGEAFHDFDPDRVAAYGDADVDRLMADPAIIRNRRKIDAAIANARATVALREDLGLDALVWSFAPAARVERPSPGWRPRSAVEVPSSTPVSALLAGELRSRGFTSVGPVIAYALMESAGLVDDHLEGCGAERPADAG